jgi:hypothetical protein
MAASFAVYCGSGLVTWWRPRFRRIRQARSFRQTAASERPASAGSWSRSAARVQRERATPKAAGGWWRSSSVRARAGSRGGKRPATRRPDAEVGLSFPVVEPAVDGIGGDGLEEAVAGDPMRRGAGGDLEERGGTDAEVGAFVAVANALELGSLFVGEYQGAPGHPKSPSRTMGLPDQIRKGHQPRAM